MPEYRYLKITSLVINYITCKVALIISKAVFLRYGNVFIENEPFIYYFISFIFNYLEAVTLLFYGIYKNVFKELIQSDKF